jgi:hypothetical protein
MESGGKVARGGGGGKSHIFDEPLGTCLLPLPNERTPWTCKKEAGEAGSVWKGKLLERRRDGWMDGDKVLMVRSPSVPTGH